MAHRGRKAQLRRRTLRARKRQEMLAQRREALAEQQIASLVDEAIGPPVTDAEVIADLASEALGTDYDPETFQHHAVCECRHGFSEHIGSDGPCTHEDGRGTCSCASYAEMPQDRQTDSVHARLRDLVASSLPATPQILLNFDLAKAGPARRAFVTAVLADGLTALTAESWRIEPGTASLERPDGSDVLFEGDNEYVVRLADGRVLHFENWYGSVDLTVAAPSYAHARSLVEDFAARFPSWAPPPVERDESKTISLGFWTDTPMGPSRRRRILESAAWDDVAPNYPEPVRSDLANLMTEFKPGAGGQLMLWQGPPGTGKTWALRALISEWRDWAEFHYITDPDAFFVGNPLYMTEVLLAETYGYIDGPTGEYVEGESDSTPWRVLILEDTGELLAAEAKDKQGQGISRLLNVVDGLMGQGLKILVLVTTNDELGDLHPAAQRPGRCAARLQFGAFSPEEASEWLGEETDEGGTLAELYARKGAAGEVAFAPDDSMPCSCGHTYADHPGGGACAIQGCDCAGFEEAALDESGDDGEAAAESATAAAVVIEPPAEQAQATGRTWRAIFCPEGRPTDDGRMFAKGAITWRDLPLTLMAQLVTEEGHDGAQVAGRIDEVWRDDADGLIMGGGVFDDGEFGLEVARMVGEEVLRGISVDIAVKSAQLMTRAEVEAGTPPDEAEGPDMLDLLLGGDGEDQPVFVVTEGVIGAVTVVPFPAFAEATISLVAGATPWPVLRVTAPIELVDGPLAASAGETPPETAGDAQGRTTEPQTAANTAVVPSVRLSGNVADARVSNGISFVPPVVASAVAPAKPPAGWFADPELDGPTPLTVTDDGRVYGHVAPWDTCHVGIPGVCQTAPASNTDYAYFHLKEVECDDGTVVPCGTLTIEAPHAPSHLSRPAATAHYDNTATAVADIVAGEDDHGIWFSGALRPDASEATVRKLRGAAPSGDWRAVKGNLEMIGVLAVNVPGFPIPRPTAEVALTASGEVAMTSLIAAGAGWWLQADAGDDEGDVDQESEEAALEAVMEAAEQPL